MRKRNIQRSCFLEYLTKNAPADYVKTPAFAKILVLLKVLNAETDFSEEHEPILQKYVETVGPENFVKIFSRIATHRDSANTFDGSVLQKVIAKGLGKQQGVIQLELLARKKQQLEELKRQKAELLKKQQEELKAKLEQERLALETAKRGRRTLENRAIC
jgi:hypothetical protein